MERAIPSGVSDSYLTTDLKRLDCWLCWQKEETEERTKKLPVNRTEQGWEEVPYREPENQFSYRQAHTLYEDHKTKPDEHRLDGLQAVIENRSDDFVVVDLDDCVNPETNEIEDWAQKFVDQGNTYTELSPSGTGLHMIFCGTISQQGWSDEEDELKGEVFHKYLVTYTGNHITGTPFRAKRNQEFLDRIFNENDIRWRDQLFADDDVQEVLIPPMLSGGG